MSDLADSIRRLTMNKVLELLAEGKTKKAACAEVNISVDTFNRYLAAYPEEANEFLVQQRSFIQGKYSEVIRARGKTIDALVERAYEIADDLDGKFPTREIISVERSLSEIQEYLERQMGIIDFESKAVVPHPEPKMNSDPAAEFLKQLNGPHLRSGRAVLSQTVEVEFGDREELSPEIIEGVVGQGENEELP